LAREAYARNQILADRALRRSVLAFRWLLFLLWVGLVQTGILDVSGVAFAISTTVIGAYDLYHTWAEFWIARTGRFDHRVARLVRYVDVMTITVAMVALHDVRNPVWSIYFLTIVGAAHFISPREMLLFVGWTIVNYLAFAGITVALGHGVTWPYAAVVAVGLALMGLNAAIIAGGEERVRQVIRQAAITDSLTGLPNRHHFHERYTDSVETSAKAARPLAVMLIDVDHFKQINDRHGHPAGDDKLRDVALALGSVMRVDDMVARYGGDEFIAIAHGTTRLEAVRLAERLRDAARRCDASVSIGVAVFPEDAADEAALIDAADAALYRAKQDGRNCVRTIATAAA
jgi:diguanylate cyclase (GGDEF)-like protein